jgi:hypothetical protein
MGIDTNSIGGFKFVQVLNAASCKLVRKWPEVFKLFIMISFLLVHDLQCMRCITRVCVCVCLRACHKTNLKHLPCAVGEY